MTVPLALSKNPNRILAELLGYRRRDGSRGAGRAVSQPTVTVPGPVNAGRGRLGYRDRSRHAARAQLEGGHCRQL